MHSQLQQVKFKSVKYRHGHLEIASVSSSSIKKLLGEPQDSYLHFWLWKYKDTTYCFNTKTSEICYRIPADISEKSC